MKLFIAWLHSRRRVIWGALVCAAVLFISFALYRLPMQAVIYPALLCLFAGLCFSAFDLRRTVRVCAMLERLCSQSIETMGELPTADGPADELRNTLIGNMRREDLEARASARNEYRELLEYFTMWAHQVKTPIASMKLTLESEDSPVSRRLSSDLFRTRQYVDMAMAYLRLGSESTDYVWKKQPLDGMIRASIRSFATEFITRRLSLQYEPIGQNVLTDEKWFRFVLEQLLSNALKYTRKGSIRIYMSDGNTLCIADTGIGIAPEDLPRVFEKGYTGCNGRVDPGASGLGLYLCRRVCENLGIDISITSGTEGTRVSLRFLPKDIRPE